LLDLEKTIEYLRYKYPAENFLFDVRYREGRGKGNQSSFRMELKQTGKQ